MGGGVQGGGYYQAVSNNLNNRLYGGNRTDFSNAGRASVAARIQQTNAMNTMSHVNQIQTVAQNMYGLQLDSSSIFSMADLNFDGTITKKEASSFMSKLPQLAAMNGAAAGGVAAAGGGDSGGGILGKIGGLLGGDDGGGLLAKAGDAIGGLFGGGDGSSGGDGGGSFLDKAGDFLGGLFG